MHRILILGITPVSVGIGGVSIHVQRLLERLNEQGIAPTLCDYKSLPLNEQVRLMKQHEIIHLHLSHPVRRFLCALSAKLMGKKLVFTIHGNLGRFAWWGNLLDMLTVKLSDVPIALNRQSYAKALKWNQQAHLISAFIPPLDDGVVPEWAVEKIDNLRKQGRKVFSVNASVRSFTHKGEETYGIDFLIGFFRQRDEALVISDPSGQYADKHKGEDLFIITGPHSTYAIYKHVDGTIRNTATDGDSLSVRESLHLGLPTLATDRVDRPEGCILFHYNDAISLGKALSSQGKAAPMHPDDPIAQITAIYQSLSKELDK